MAKMKKGMQAPEFRLNDKDGQERTLSEFAGRPVVLYFYPRDNTSGCTRQALAFAAMYGEFVKAGAEVIGVSKDRRMAGEEALREGERGRCPLRIRDRTRRQTAGSGVQSKAGYRRGRRAGADQSAALNNRRIKRLKKGIYHVRHR